MTGRAALPRHPERAQRVEGSAPNAPLNRPIHQLTNSPTHRRQNGRSSSSGGGPSYGGGASLRLGADDEARRGTGGGYGLGEPSRGGQMTPSQPGPPRSRGLFLHLKSGARGLRLLRRSSHIAPPQIGQAGMPSAGGRGAGASALAARAPAGAGVAAR